MAWPATADELAAAQIELAAVPRRSIGLPDLIGGVFVCFGRGVPSPWRDLGWASAVSMRDGRLIEAVTVSGDAGGPYVPGLLALREGSLLEAAVRSLRRAPDVLIVNATGRDHPRRAGLALHLGAVVGVPTVGVTNRPLLAEGPWPEGSERGATAPLRIEGELVAHWVRTRALKAPVVAHPAWGTDLDVAVEILLRTAEGRRTPEPLRQARRLSRTARTAEVPGETVG